MAERPLRGTGAVPQVPAPVLAAMHAALHDVAARTIEAVASEVPGYRGTLDENARHTLAQAVELALRGFLALAAQQQDPSAPLAPALEGAYALGRGEARSGRSMDALLAAYRVGARVSWRGLADPAAAAGLPAEGLVSFAELVFAYIDQLSAASVAGHADELAVEGLQRQRHLERLAHGLVIGAPEEALLAAAQRAGWTPPGALVAVILPEARVGDVLARIDPRTLHPVEDVPDLGEGAAVLLVPDPDARFESGLERGLAGGRAVVGPTRPWLRVHRSFARAARAWELAIDPRLAAGPAGSGPAGSGPAGSGPAGSGPAGSGPAGSGSEGADARPGPGTGGAGLPPSSAASGIVHTDHVLAELVLGADPEAMADLRAQALAPLRALRPAQADRLAETLRAWLLHRGRRDEVAAALFVHPQTVRYRMGQVRSLFGNQLDDPRAVLNLTLALGAWPGSMASPSSDADHAPS